MCARYTLKASPEIVARLFELTRPLDFRPRYNLAPTQDAPIIVADPDGGRTARFMRWGLIPSWADDPAIGHRLINARAETAADKPAFRSAFRHRRCLIPADGFYEWHKAPGGKTPHHIHLHDNTPFAFAGLWETWRSPDGSSLETFTILTTEPNELVKPLHNRMPVMLGATDGAAWLDAKTTIDNLTAKLGPSSPESMQVQAVSRYVNTPAHDDPRCLESIDGPSGLFE